MYLSEHGHPIDESDPATFISALDHAAPEHLHVEIFTDGGIAIVHG